MQLNHLSLIVTDPTAAHDFLEKYFGLRSLQKNKNMAFLSDDTGAVIVLTSVKVVRESEVRYPTGFHIGFIQPSEEAVNAINRRLREDGFDVPAPSHQHGSWTFYLQAPGGFTIEVLS